MITKKAKKSLIFQLNFKLGIFILPIFLFSFVFFVNEVSAIDGLMNGKTVTGQTDNYLFWLQTFDKDNYPFYFDQFFVNKSGSVGIGNVTPAYKLDVSGTGRFTQPVLVGTPTAAGHATTKSYVDSTVVAAAGGGVGAGTSGQTLRHNGTSWVANSTLYNNGTNIGIGTTSPTQKLDVAGNIMLNRNNLSWSREQYDFTSSTVRANINPFSIKIWDNYNGASAPTTYGTLFDIYGRPGHEQSQLYFGSDGNIRYRDAFYSETSFSPWSTLLMSTTDVNSSGNLRITGAGAHYISAGSVGIGTTTPGYKLDVSGTGRFTQPVLVATPTLDGHAATKNYVDSTIGGGSGSTVGYWTMNGTNISNSNTGNVGVGTTNPLRKLDIAGGVFIGSTVGAVEISNSGYTGYLGGHNSLVFSTNHLNVGITAGEKMRITNAGNVGIGTTAPAYKLDVTGTGRFTQPVIVGTPTAAGHATTKSYVDSTAVAAAGGGIPAAVNGYTLRASGTSWVANSNLYNNGANVGIGTVSPIVKLHVNGTAVANSFAGSSGTGEGLHILSPGGAKYSTTASTVTGAIKIVLPQSWTNTMMRMRIDIYEYASSESFSVMVGGYNHASASWANTFAQIIGTKVNRDFTVRFGHDGAKNAIWIGDTNTTWSYPQVVVTDFYAGYANYNVDLWDDGWDIYFDNNFTDDTILATHVDNLVSPWITNSNNVFNLTNNIGIGTTAPAYKLDVSGTGRFTQPVIVGAPTATNHATTKSYVDSAAGGGVGAGTSGQTLRHNGTSWVANSVLFNNGTNVGIGTTVPANTLTIQKTNTGGMGANLALVNLGTPGTVGSSASIDFGLEKSTYTDTSGNAQIKAYLEGSNNSTSLIFSTYNGSSFGERLRLLGNGNVGIGTTAPAYKLDVTGTGRFTQPVIVGAPTLDGHAATKNYVDSTIGGGSGSTVGYWTMSGANIYNSNTTGNVGIGTTNPSVKTHIQATDARLRVDSTTSGNIPYLQLFNSGDSKYGALGYDTTNEEFVFSPQGSIRMVIESSGNVGIGTTAPAYKLDVSGTGRFTQPVIVGAPTATNHATTKSYVDSTASSAAGGGVGAGTTGQTLRHNGTSWVANSVLFNNGTNVGIGTSNPDWKAHIAASGQSVQLALERTEYGPGRYDIGADSSGLKFWANGYISDATPDIVFDTSGNVGIGTTAPAYKLDVTGTGRFTQPVIVGAPTATNHATTKSYVDSTAVAAAGGGVGAGTSGQTLRHDGTSWAANSTLYNNGTNVGIGTTAPGNKLDVRDTQLTPTNLFGVRTWNQVTPQTYLQSTNASIGSGGTLGFGGRDTTATDYKIWRIRSLFSTGGAGYGSNLGLLFDAVTDNTGNSNLLNVMALKGDGNVGIGNTAPAYKLDVTGTGRFTQPLIVGTPTATNHATTKSYVDSTASSAAGGGVGAGTSGQTLRHNGTSWVANSVLFNNGTNVGIGTTNPGRKLVVQTATGLSSYAAHFMQSGTTVGNSTLLGFAIEAQGWSKGAIGFKRTGNYDTGDLVFLNRSIATDGSSATTEDDTKMVIKSSGNVGIGTTAPAYKLDVTGTGRFTQPVIVGAPTATNHATTKSYVDSTAVAAAGGGIPAAVNGYTLRASGTSWVANSNLYNNGTNVGIGTTNPANKLSVAGGLDFSGVMKASQTLSTYNNLASYYVGGSVTGALVINTNIDMTDSGTWINDLNINLYNYNAATQELIDIAFYKYYNGSTGLPSFVNAGYVRSGSINPTVRLAINSSNKVVVIIGDTASTWSYPQLKVNKVISSVSTLSKFTEWTIVGGVTDLTGYTTITSPSQKNIIVAQSISNTGGYTQTGSSNNIFSGSVGIGTTAPAYKLDVTGTGRFTQPVLVGTPTAAGHAVTKSYVDSAAGGGVGAGSSGQTLRHNGTSWVANSNFYNNGTSVGIGTTNPGTYKLNVAGSAYIGGALELSAGSNLVTSGTISANKINVGTIDPLYNLGGVNYASFAASVVGGVKEETTGRLVIDQKVAGEYQKTIDFKRQTIGSDLWVWYNVIDFSKENVEVLLTPYGKSANVYYSISGEKLIFHSDVPVEVSYRLIAKRFDWKNWPTEAKDQSEKPNFILK